MGMHAARYPAHVLLSGALPEATADDHRLRIDQVDRRGDPGAERLHRPIDEPGGEVIAVLQRAIPDAAGEAVAAMLLHDLEEDRLCALLDLPARLDLHRPAARIGLHAALAPAGAAGPALFDDHVADLRRRAAAQPLFAVQDQAAADAGSPPDAEHGVELLAGAELELPLPRHGDVVADLDRRAKLLGEVLGEREGIDPVRQVAGHRDDPGLLVGIARGADADAAQIRSLQAGLISRLAHRLGHPLGDVLGAAGGRRGPT